jgi:anaerobic selenocysteine-containing dehydrogenase
MTVPAKVRLTCPLDCPDACSLLVTLENGRAVKVEGDPIHPTTQGFACSKTYKYPMRAYHDERPKFPLKRVGVKGAGQWARVSWDEALDEIATKLKGILEIHGPESILRYNYAGTMGMIQNAHPHAFFRALGAIELEETICSSAGGEGWSATYGAPRFSVDPEDVPNAKLILLWGINSLATNSHLTPFLKKARANGARIVHIDPYESKTSLFADEHIRIRPGTDAALALSMANIIISRNLHDQDFLERTSKGFKAYAKAASEWNLERASALTGISSEVIERLALEYGNTTPSYIRVGYGLTRTESGANGLRAAVTLPALTGQWQHVGGGAALSSSGAFALNRSSLGGAHLVKASTRRVNMVQLASALEPALNQSPKLGSTKISDKTIHAMFVYNSNPAVVAPDTSRVIAGMRREDLFTVVLENAMTETADLADFVLPATTFLEHDDLYISYGHHYLSLNRAPCEPYFESKSNTQIFAELGKRMGITEPSLYSSTDDLIRGLLDTTHPHLEGITLERLEADGYVRLNLPSPYLPFKDGTPNFPDGKIRLDPPPHQLEFVDDLTPEFPLRLITPPAHHFLNTTYGPLEVIQELEGIEPHLKVHPNDAAKFGVKDGELARLSTRQGSVTRKARVTNATTPGVIVVEGTWWNARGQDGQGINALTSERLTDLGAGSTFHNNPVRLEPI